MLEASVIHGCSDMGPGKGIRPHYPVQVSLLSGGGWYEAADQYKSWAVRQKWCSRGKLSGRAAKEGSQWLHEDMGAATFGINAGSDRTAWIQKYHDSIGTSMFHILGPDWTHRPQTFGSGVPGGYGDWFPTRFNPENIALIRKLGHRFARSSSITCTILTEPTEAWQGSRTEISRVEKRGCIPLPVPLSGTSVYP